MIAALHVVVLHLQHNGTITLAPWIVVVAIGLLALQALIVLMTWLAR